MEAISSSENYTTEMRDYTTGVPEMEGTEDNELRCIRESLSDEFVRMDDQAQSQKFNERWYDTSVDEDDSDTPRYYSTTDDDDIDAYEHEDDEHIPGSMPIPEYDKQNWHPYASKAEALLDLLDNIPRRPISGGVMNMFIMVLKMLEVPGVPSLKGLRKRQAELN